MDKEQLIQIAKLLQEGRTSDNVEHYKSETYTTNTGTIEVYIAKLVDGRSFSFNTRDGHIELESLEVA